VEVDKPGLPPRLAGRRRLITPRPATRGENTATTALNATVVVTALARHTGTPRATSRRYTGAQTAATVTARNTVSQHVAEDGRRCDGEDDDDSGESVATAA
jgi:hypothetical protein